MPPQIWGLTGAIGSGKSALAVFLKANGIQVINADDIGHEILRRKSIKLALVEAFGDDILSSSVEINRAELGSRAFQNAEKARILNEITHPPLLAEIRKAISKTDGQILIIDAALFLEWGTEINFHGIVVVDAPQSVRKARLPRLTYEQFNKRERCQIPPADKRRAADILVSNDSDINTLNNKALQLIKVLKTGHPSFKRESTLIL